MWVYSDPIYSDFTTAVVAAEDLVDEMHVLFNVEILLEDELELANVHLVCSTPGNLHQNVLRRERLQCYRE